MGNEAWLTVAIFLFGVGINIGVIKQTQKSLKDLITLKIEAFEKNMKMYVERAINKGIENYEKRLEAVERKGVELEFKITDHIKRSHGHG